MHAFKARAIDYFYAIINTVQHINFKSLYEQSSAVEDDQKILIAKNQIIVAKHQETNDLKSQKINLLQLQILELQKFILAANKKSLSLTLGATNSR